MDNNTDRTYGRTAVLLRVILLFISVLFIIIGLLGREYVSVLNKAVRICLECIGIG